MAVTAAEKFKHDILIVERVISITSLVGTLMLILLFLTIKELRRRPFNRLLFLAAWGNIMANIATLIGRQGSSHGPNSALCKVQATLIHWFMPADTLWMFCMAVNVLLTFQTTKMRVDLQKLEKWYLILCYGVPAIPALTYLGLDLAQGKDFYGNAILWCWISEKHDTLRMATFYGPVWIILLTTMALYAYNGRRIFKGHVRNENIRFSRMDEVIVQPGSKFNGNRDLKLAERGVSPVSFTSSAAGAVSQFDWSIGEPKRTLSRVSSPPPIIRSPSRTQQLAVEASEDLVPTEDAIHLGGPRPYDFTKGNVASTITISPVIATTINVPASSQSTPGIGDATGEGNRGSVRTSVASKVSSSTSSAGTVRTSIISRSETPTFMVPNAPTPPPPAPRKSRLASLTPRISSAVSYRARANRGARQYARVALLLYICILIEWVPSTVNRAYGMANKHKADKHVAYALSVTAAAVLPTQGLFNALVFCFTSRKELALRYQDFRRWFKGKGKVEEINFNPSTTTVPTVEAKPKASHRINEFPLETHYEEDSMREKSLEDV